MERTTSSQSLRDARPMQGATSTTIGLVLASIPMLAFLLLPILAVLLRLDPIALINNLANQEIGQAIWLSIVTTACSTVLGLVFGTPLAYLLARRRFSGRNLLDTLIDLPMVLPPSVAGIALLVAFGRRGIVGAWLDDLGISIAFTTVAVVLAQTFVATPFYIKTAVGGFAGVDRELEQAAAVDGASRWQIFSQITLPMCWSVLLGGLVMTWARALGEFGATIIFAGNFPGRTQTMPLAIYLGFEANLDLALTLAIMLMGASFLVLFLVKLILRQRITIV